MSDDEPNDESFEAKLRRIAEQLSRSVEHLDEIDFDQVAEAIGIDPDRARELLDGAGQWLSEADSFANDVAVRFSGMVGDFVQGQAQGQSAAPPTGTGPHPLDQPTPAQGLALSAIDSGRWKVAPGSHEILADGDGPGPTDAVGLVGELRARDWINADGEMTLVGRNALTRWMNSSSA